MPVLRKASARWSGFATANGALAMGSNIEPRMRLQARQVDEIEALPHLALPKRVEALNEVLKAVFKRGCKHRDDTQRQTQAADTPDGVGKLVRALEAGVVIKLSIMRQPDRTPTSQQAADHRARVDAKPGPSIGLISVQRGGSKHRELRSFIKLQVLDQIKTIELGSPCSHLRQMPAARRRGPSQAFARIRSPMAPKDTSDRGHRRHRAISCPLQSLMNGRCSTL